MWSLETLEAINKEFLKCGDAKQAYENLQNKPAPEKPIEPKEIPNYTESDGW